MSTSWPRAGLDRRLARVLGPTGRTLMIPLDDSLISGPKVFGIGTPRRAAELALKAGVDSLLGYPGLLASLPNEPRVGLVVNLTASTTLAGHHVDKIQSTAVEAALSLAADAVAVHVNVTAETEPSMLHTLGSICTECQRVGLPVIGIAYPRKRSADGGDDNFRDLLATNPDAYTVLVCHAIRIAVDLGCAVVKTQFPGSAEGMEELVAVCDGVPILVAGGPRVGMAQYFDLVRMAMRGGATGVSVGRNFYQSEDPSKFISTLRKVLSEVQADRQTTDRSGE